jgi:putative endonuclease
MPTIRINEQVTTGQTTQPPHSGEGRNPRPLSWPEVPPLFYDAQQQKAWVYIIANKPNGTLYTGFTKNLPVRIYQHRQGEVDGFAKKYGCDKLVYFEGYDLITNAITRETNMKSWPRVRKIRHILAVNPQWDDLYEQL